MTMASNLKQGFVFLEKFTCLSYKLFFSHSGKNIKKWFTVLQFYGKYNVGRPEMQEKKSQILQI